MGQIHFNRDLIGEKIKFESLIKKIEILKDQI